MFVGHTLLAFALAAAAADALDWPRARALAVGFVAGAFALVPDVDILYALVGIVGVDGVFAAAEAFWAASDQVHRTVTHSLLVGLVAAVAVYAWRTAAVEAGTSLLDRLFNHRLGQLLDRRFDHRPDRRFVGRAVAVVLLIGLVVVAFVETGALAAAVTMAFALAVLGVTHGAGKFDLGPRATAFAAALGLLSHPFGDLFTGEPPAMLYPLDVTLFASRITLHPDPTLHLLAAMGIELATAWLAALVYVRLDGPYLDGYRLRDHVTGQAALGLAFAGSVFLLPTPTLETSYRFVFGVVGVGLVVAAPLSVERDRAWLFRRVLSGLAAVTLAAIAFALTYVLVGEGVVPALPG